MQVVFECVRVAVNVNDDKLTIGPNITYIPRHLTDYKTEISGPNIQNYYYIILFPVVERKDVNFLPGFQGIMYRDWYSP